MVTEIDGAQAGTVVGATAAGMALATLFMGGLWVTVRALPHSRHPALLFLASYSLRLMTVAVGFALLAREGLQLLLLALLGFLLARGLLLHRFSRPEEPPPSEEVSS